MKPKLLIVHSKVNPYKTCVDSPSVLERFDIKVAPRIIDNPDVVYCQTYGKNEILNDLLHWNGPTVVHVGGDMWQELPQYEQKLRRVAVMMQRVSKVICVSKSLSVRIKKRANLKDNVSYLPGGLWGIDHIPKGIEISRFIKKDIYSNNKKPKIIMVMAMTVEQKYMGIPKFLRAVNKLLLEKNVRVICIGRNKRKSLTQKWSRTWCFDNIGEAKDYPSFLRNADLFVHPSLFDGWPRAVAEAMCTGLPMLVFDIPGARAVSDNPIFCDHDDPEDILDKFHALLKYEELRRYIGNKVHEEAVIKTEQHRNDYVNILESVL